MIALIYLMIAALVFFVIGYMVSRVGCSSDKNRYLKETPVDSVTHDDGKCEKSIAIQEGDSKIKEQKTDLSLDKGGNTDEMQDMGKESDTGSQQDVDSEEMIAPEGLLDTPRGGKKDNLSKIKGIGIKIEEQLNAIGIWHFDQIAVWTEENIAWADRELAFPGRAKREQWVEQAKLLAEGKETEFSRRVEKGEVATSKKD